MASDEARTRDEVRREAAPALAAAAVVLVVLAVVSAARGWELLAGVPGWIWVGLAIPELVLFLDLVLGTRPGAADDV